MGESEDDVVVSDDGRRLRPVKSLLRALDVLTALARSERPLTLGEIVEQTDFSRTAAYNVLATYELRGLVRRDDQGRYELGWGLFELGERARSRSDLTDVARPVVEDLAESTGETVLLGVLDQGSVIYVEKAESRRSIRMVEAPGRRLPLHESATGLVLLAHAGTTLRDRYLEQQDSRSGLTQRVATILATGVAVSVQDLDPDLSSASVPVHGPDDHVLAALTVAGPASRLTRERVEEFLPALVASAASISKAVGGRTHP
ncbi:IclR family transcriptional regulator [Nocardioides anomalus]|uniref:Glycerol operon regulatory protein n=1 Tax=Nocardioides anomalus TaxID=2712223 RepID=A0A6G6WDU4_9ACTN|nr:IclR family transcriptional regulator [Nocardioides anomalus]QIG43376.1 IclR family transcriptional regulator [Nocardioides anomalus]